MNFKPWQQHSELLPAERLANTYICSVLTDEHGIRTNWHQTELHAFIFTYDLSWLETFLWDRLLLENGNLFNAKYFTWNTGRFDGKRRAIPLAYWVAHLPPAPWAWLLYIYYIAASCARDPRFSSIAWESKSSSSNQSSALYQGAWKTQL